MAELSTGLTTAARDELLARMRAIIARHGSSTYVAAPVLEPTDAFFPDPYTEDLYGVRTLARRLMAYAGLGDLPVHVVGPTRELEMPLPESIITLTAAAASGIELTVFARGAAADVPLVLAHEVARAFVELRSGPSGGGHPYRAVDLEEHELDEAHEEDVSLTAMLLGFGLLATKGSHQYRAQGELQGVMTVTRWVHMALGALSPLEATYLLAVQAVVRGVDDETVARWLAYLGPNQRADLKRFLRELADDADTLAERLGLPPREEWPDPVEPATQPLADDGWEPELVAETEGGPERPVFRLPQDHGWTLLQWTAGLSVGALFATLFVHADWLLHTLVAGGILSAFSYYAGKSWPRADLCSRCEAVLGPTDERCRACDGVVVGTVRPGETFLDAEERVGVSAFGVLAGEQADAAERYVDRGVKCPHCGWIPDGEAHWGCDDCRGELFNTFEHGGECPECRKVFEETSCPSCDHISPYEWWWPDEAS